MDSGFQLKKGSSVARTTTLNPLVSGGNSFDITGTGIAQYIRIDNYQNGAEVSMYVPSGVTLAHNAGSPSPGVSAPMFLLGEVDLVSPGIEVKFKLDGTYWQEQYRTKAVGKGRYVLEDSPTLITPVLGVATATSINKIVFTAPATSATLTLADSTTTTITGGGTLALAGFTLTAPATGTAVIQSNYAAQLASYYPLRVAYDVLIATQAANTYIMLSAASAAVTSVSGTSFANSPAVIYIDSADYPSVNGLTPKLRIRAVVSVNNTTPTGDFSFALYPLTMPGSGGGAAVKSYTIGSVVAGSSTGTITPVANTSYHPVGSDFALPANGLYAICVTTTSTIATSSFAHIQAELQITYK